MKKTNTKKKTMYGSCSPKKGSKKRTVKTLNENYEVVTSEDAGVPAWVEVTKHDYKDELSRMDTYNPRYTNDVGRAYDRYGRSADEKMGGIGLNYGDW